MSTFISRTRTKSSAVSPSGLKPNQSSSILRKLSQRNSAGVNSLRTSTSLKRESRELFWDYNVKTFQSIKGSTYVKEEMFDQYELDAEYINIKTEEVGSDEANGLRRKGRFAESKDAPKQVSRMQTLNSFGFSLDESGTFDYYDDSTEDVHASKANQRSRRRNHLRPKMRPALEVCGSFGSDNCPEAVVTGSGVPTAKKGPSLRNKATAAVATTKPRNQLPRDHNSDHGGKVYSNDVHQHLEPRQDRAKRGSLIGMIILIKTKSKRDSHPSKTEKGRAKKRNSLENMIKSAKLVARNVVDRRTEKNDHTQPTSSKPAYRPRNQRRATQDSLGSSATLFDKVAAEKFKIHGSFLTQKTASTATTFRSDQEDCMVKFGGEDGYVEKICSILYTTE